ncbi:CRISPR-associated protein, Cse4 family [Pseudogulbenkiania sp. NH8B]|uniref:type I-E CRISPR-associated protein Cas7/Cse4/CasC n=1 Tax=Pseudogulbenkiania sp. (strain NH8B) TaxID=748280 RepID=UPI0002279716|nr:type I-E CRISPR-associated protein Cas7/Cse4/CasC [Pseudogulbenkiania sp. NH8B]BAK75524.1 CRISPR-associated protein, Cse4 family [Pseudogulbenkiania sp. NH8B]
MTRFVQLHLLVSFPPSNLNRDDLGRPKTAKLGGIDRLRVSSQSLKRAWRTSEVFQQALAGHVGTRTKRLGREAYDRFIAAGIKEKDAQDWAGKLAGVYGKLQKDGLEIEQLVHIAPAEHDKLDELVTTLIAEKRAPLQEELDTLLEKVHAVDIAMFGRMLAAKTQFNEEAAVQVAHAIGVHASAIEDDFFTAVDDLNNEDSGAGHVGEAGFAAAVFYQYLCIDRDQLLRNLGGDEELTLRAIQALVEAALTVAPSGKQNSFASRAYAHYALAEKGTRQPRSLSLAFVQPVKGGDVAARAVDELETLRAKMDAVYGDCAASRAQFDVLKGQGRLAELLAFAADPHGFGDA